MNLVTVFLVAIFKYVVCTYNERRMPDLLLQKKGTLVVVELSHERPTVYFMGAVM